MLLLLLLLLFFIVFAFNSSISMYYVITLILSIMCSYYFNIVRFVICVCRFTVLVLNTKLFTKKREEEKAFQEREKKGAAHWTSVH